MRIRILTILALFVILFNLSSCYMGTWERYHHKTHYVHKKHYRSFHKHRNRDW